MKNKGLKIKRLFTKEGINPLGTIEYENGEFLRFAAPVAGMVFYSWFYKTDFIETARKLWYPVKSTYLEVEEG